MKHQVPRGGWAKIPQAAFYAGDVSTRTVRGWLKKGLKHARIGGCILIRYADLDEFLEQFTGTSDKVNELVTEVLADIRGKKE